MVDTPLSTRRGEKDKGLVQSGELGDLYYYDSVRINLGLFQHDIDVIWDLAVHDFAIMDHVLAQSPALFQPPVSAMLPGARRTSAISLRFLTTTSLPTCT